MIKICPYARVIAILFMIHYSLFTASAQQRHSDGLDDVLQYVPYASVFALKACGVESRDDWKKLTLTTVASIVASTGTGWVLKHAIKESRPDGRLLVFV